MKIYFKFVVTYILIKLLLLLLLFGKYLVFV